MDHHLRPDGHRRRPRHAGAKARRPARPEPEDRSDHGGDPVHQPRESARTGGADARTQMRLPASGSREALWLVAAVVVFGILGIALGLNAPVQIPPGYARYTAVMILAALDSVLGAVKAWLNGNFENKVFISGLLVNSLAAGALTYLGDKLGVELYFAAIVAFGVRIFDNLAVIRRHLL